ncbi:PEP-utilizing enzyme [Gordonia sp. GONU]|uniref:PEP-utilizing enzyme n=1 Tax=Gordonia sp. GONU TaxID=2972949 RepID=UPI0021AD4C6B|nr:PEP-utilizing enzyme [Gordonia sp. GONU]MCR8898637.1 PEP-utilizing enzyme [Gordonia sp. GONU]
MTGSPVVENGSTSRPTPGPTADLAASPVHVPGHRLRWTTANVDEGLPGIVTPMTWSLYFPPTEQTMRDCWVDLGVMPRSAREIPDDVDLRFLSVAHGHAIANVDNMGQMAARVPGGSAAMMEEQLFGSVQAGGLPEPRGWAKMRRYPIVAVKFPVALRRAIKALPALAEESERWWSRRAFALDSAGLDEATAALVEARDMFEKGLSVHMPLSMAAQGLMGQVQNLAESAGLASGGELIKSDEGTAEFELVRDLWRLSRDEIDVNGFVRRHGYHGPREGLVDSVVWREDSTMVTALAARYRTRADAENVDDLVVRRRREHDEAVRRLHAGLSPARRRLASALIGFAAQVPTWRETGRANILRGVDVTRAAARSIGRQLADAGVLAEPGDVFFLTIDELASRRTGEYADLVARRRLDHEAYSAIDLPHVWHGAPEPVVSTAPRSTDDSDATDDTAAASTGDTPEIRTLTGLGVSAGVAQGRVQVIRDLDDAEIEDGTVMVCKATDPGWASLFPLAEAVVTDVGSAMSHAAIVCRELGLPCVANTRTGTTELKDGMLVRVDGTAGTVEVLAPQ